MNGQDRHHVLTSSTLPPSGSDLINSVNNGSAPSGAANSNSWLRDMIADPVRAAQVGILNPRQENPLAPRFNASAGSSAHQRSPFLAGMPVQNPLLQSFYNGSPSLNSMMPPMQQSVGEQGHALRSNNSAVEEQRLLVPTATSVNHSAAVHPVFSQPHNKMYPRELGPSSSVADSEVAAKRMRVAPSAESNASMGQSTPAARPGKGPIPHRPNYFHHGSVIQLGENKLKKIQDLQTADFEISANDSSNLSLDCSTVIRISEDLARGTASLTFSVGDHKHKPVEATVEATLEHPFFVFDRGWSSVNPEKTLLYYKIRCQQLKVRDRCISLKFKDDPSINSTGSTETIYGVNRNAVTDPSSQLPQTK